MASECRPAAPGLSARPPRRLKRMVSRRVYQSNDRRLLFVDGRPCYERMLRQLCRLLSGEAARLEPADFGLGGGNLDEVTPIALAIGGRWLTKWIRWLALHQAHDRSAKAESRQLARRLGKLHEWRRAALDEVASGESPWLLHDEQQRELQSLAARCAVAATCPHAQTAARIVMWLGGAAAAERFYAALAHLPASSAADETRALLRASLAKLEVWIERASRERPTSLRAEIKHWSGQLPVEVRRRAGLSGRLPQMSPIERLELQRNRCAEALREHDGSGRPLLLAAVATLAVCDQSATPIPAALLQLWSGVPAQKQVRESCLALLAESTHAGYDQLLELLAERPDIRRHIWSGVRRMFAGGATPADVRWVLDEGLEHFFPHQQVSPRTVRRRVQRLSKAGIVLDPDELWSLCEAMRNDQQGRQLDVLVDWIAKLPAAAGTPRLRGLIRSVLVGSVARALGTLTLEPSLRQWSDLVARRHRTPAGDRMSAWRRHVDAIAAVAGKRRPDQPVASAEVRSEKRRAEYAYLRSLACRGAITPAQAARMQHLRQGFDGQVRDCREARRELHRLQKSYVVASVEALAHLIRQQAEQQLDPRLAHRLRDARLERLLKFAAWVGRMSSDEQQLLGEILTAHHERGQAYRRYLAANADWLSLARRQPFDLDVWLRPPAWTGEVAGAVVTIAASHDPVETFLMGHYFGTCLSFGDCNEMSVLANAVDANKLVMYVRDASGNVLGRQLLAVSTDWTLLGYRRYTNAPEGGSPDAESLRAALANYGYRLAERCGLATADAGEPADIGQHFWYDDCPVEWPAPPRPQPVPADATSGWATSPMGAVMPVG